MKLLLLASLLMACAVAHGSSSSIINILNQYDAPRHMADAIAATGTGTNIVVNEGQDHHRQLQDRSYDIGAPTVEINGLEISLLYLVRDQIQVNNVVVQLLRGRNCNVPITAAENNFMAVDVIPDDVVDGTGGGTRVMTVSLNVDNLKVADSRIYQAIDDERGRLNFCVDFKLQDAEFKTVQRNLVSPMVFGINPITNIGLTNLLEETNEVSKFDIESFECDEANNPIPTNPPKVYSQGSKIRLCIQPSFETYRDFDVRMSSIYAMDIERGGDDGQSEKYHNQQVVVPISRIANLQLTRIECIAGERTCAITTTLDNDFFHSKGSVRIIGIVYLQYSYGSGGDNDIRRELQDAGGAENNYRVPGANAGDKPFVLSLPIEPSSKKYGATGYLCDGRNLPLPTNANAESRFGETIRVCIEPSSDARENSVYINKVSNFQLKRKENEDTNQDVVATVPEFVDEDDFAFSYCIKGSSMCIFKTKLKRHMFQNNGTVLFTADVDLQFGTVTQKQASTTINRRHLQDSTDLSFAGSLQITTNIPVLQDPSYIEDDEEDLDDILREWWQDSPVFAKIVYVLALVALLLFSCCCVYFFCCQDLIGTGGGGRRKKNNAGKDRSAPDAMSINPNDTAFGDVLGPPTALLNGSHRSLMSNSTKGSRQQHRGMTNDDASQYSRRSMQSGTSNHSRQSMQSSSNHSRRSTQSSASSAKPSMRSSSNHSNASTSRASTQRQSNHNRRQPPPPMASPHYTKSPYHRRPDDESEYDDTSSYQQSSVGSRSSARSKKSEQPMMLPFE
eukprot:CAMPEP_0119548278 /NCGR_PEP_ID=MMETSP1352-20130426/2217_1 /TAXON_ID=265584 /ORGANISM="Stauroneis constricta, Strain CCMP1120" /LENGTH=789 /DNA_ID=CAMNT_0007593497 /DNA_START=2680 /DNA_END=5049 /DNA_ORIENTATION=+